MHGEVNGNQLLDKILCPTKWNHMMIGNLLRPITKEQIEQYEKNGVVCVRGHFNRD